MTTAPPRSADGTPHDATVLNRRERKKLETRAALEQAALRLFAQQGYEATTVEEIAEAADVAVRTFFRYYQSKQHVLYGDVALDITDRLRVALSRQPADGPILAAVGAALESMELDDAEHQQQILQRMKLVATLPELAGAYHLIFHDLHNVIAEYVAGRCAQRRYDFFPQLVANAAIGSIKAALTTFEAYGSSGRNLRSLRREAYTTLTAGISEPRRALTSGRISKGQRI
jgi:AcrR family transcriptional regulator